MNTDKKCSIYETNAFLASFSISIPILVFAYISLIFYILKQNRSQAIFIKLNFSTKEVEFTHQFVDNFHQIRLFYSKEMTHKENSPTKLAFTKKVKHKTAIFGLITNYQAPKFYKFFDSLACTGYNDTIILLYANLDLSTKFYLISFSRFFKLIMVSVSLLSNKISIGKIEVFTNGKFQKTILKEFSKTAKMIELPFVSGDFRFEIAYYLYKNHFFDEYDILFLTDIRDVLFQEDFRMFNYTEGVYVVEEALIPIKNSFFWLEMFNLSFKSFEHKSELCVGTLLLVGNKSFSFLEDLHKQLFDHIDKVVRRPNFQGILNYLVYNNTYHYPEGFIKFITTKHGIINSIGKFNYHLNHFNSKNYFYNASFKFHPRSIFDVFYHDHDYILYNQDLQKVAVIHHTKYHTVVDNYTYNGLLSNCLRNKQDIYIDVMKSHKLFE